MTGKAGLRQIKGQDILKSEQVKQMDILKFQPFYPQVLCLCTSENKNHFRFKKLDVQKSFPPPCKLGWLVYGCLYVPSFVYKALIVSGECYCLGLNIWWYLWLLHTWIWGWAPLSFTSVSVSKTAKRFIEDVSLEQGIASQSGVSSLYVIGGTSIESWSLLDTFSTETGANAAHVAFFI